MLIKQVNQVETNSIYDQAEMRTSAQSNSKEL